MVFNEVDLKQISLTHNKTRWRDTERRYLMLLEQYPNHHQAHDYLGLLYLEHALSDKAILQFKKAISFSTMNADYHHHLAKALNTKSLFQEGLSHLLMAYDINPNDLKIVMSLASLHAKMNQPQKALSWFVKGLKLAPESDHLHYQLGLFFLKQNRLEEAIKQFHNVIALDSNHFHAYFYLGSIYLEQGMLDKATDTYLKALAIDEENSDCLVNLGTIKLKQNKPQEAIQCFAQALAYDNDCLEAEHNLAATFMQYDRFDNALTHYDELLKKDPNNEEYLYNMGVANMMLSKLEDAIVFFEKTIKYNPDHTDSVVNLAAIYSRQKNKSKTIHYLKQAIQLNPNDKASQFMLDALTEKASTQTPNAYVKNLFDNYALNYDSHLKDTLNYQLPKLIQDKLANTLNHEQYRILELGVGTGLLGPILKPYAKQLVGVDLSSKMLAFANKTGCYHALIESEIVSYIQQKDLNYDLILAADVLPYLGELSSLFSSIKKILHKQSLFIFTIECSDVSPFELTSTGRFKHHQDYIKNLLIASGLKLIEQEKVIARYQENEPVDTMLYIVSL